MAMREKRRSLKISSDTLDTLSVAVGRDSIDDIINYVAIRYVTNPISKAMLRLSNVDIVDNYWRRWYGVAARIQHTMSDYQFDFNGLDATQNQR